ncbi:MAG TPA: cupin domain-containing protein [Noviherbaspirillum sp.]|uniref:cupin domain-containing protein n=1 Tax=Noviherbaspirillum sp. TaxID=1926288 RepID=UPI002D2D8581|nr:cupin domain-containing protein [Noviherbaspirillum sp.]HYD96380.1 cupin domain-containing protein [Noviherbaspirillum sp.]
MYVIANQAPAATGIPGIEHVTLAGSDDGLRRISVWQQSLAPGAATPPHRHDCEEVVLCRAGAGELHIGECIERFGADMTVLIPADVDHQIVSVGKEALQLVAVFSATPVATWLPDGAPIELPWRS